MPIYVVGERNQRVSIPNEALAVSITGSVADAELDVRASAQQLVVRPTAHRAVLPEIAGEVTVGVRPVGTARFGAGTVVHLEIAHDNPTEVDPVQVLFDPVDVSGESGVVFAALRPQGSFVEVGVIAVADVPLSPLGSAARSSARQLIGRTPAQYDEFARDIVNFLQYASDPTQVERQGMGVWVVLFLLMFTGIAYMLKQEYWKDVR